jgi:3',5'-cyclic AMP phosphodiesterase CpdA
MRIAHISDLHFGRHNPALLEPFFEDLRVLCPDIIIISGDLTQRALPEQFKLFSDFLQCLKIPVLVVPGNHDIPLYNPLSRFLHPFKRYKNYISTELEVSFSNDEVNILGVNSVCPYQIKDGRLTKRTLERINTHFSSSSTQLNILFFHHNLKYFSGMHHPLNNAEEFMDYLLQSPVHIVCTGHLHYANLHLIIKNNGVQCVLLHAGSTFCHRTSDKKNSYYFINTNELKCAIDLRIFADDAFSSHQKYELDFTVV